MNLDLNEPSDIVLTANNLNKKYSKNLKRSMVYGISELLQNFLGIKPDRSELRPAEFWALKNASFELRKGEVLGIIGPNGSGKSTLLRLIAGIYPPDKGKITIRGKAAALMSLSVGFHPNLSGYENIFLKGSMLGLSKKEISEKIDKIVKFAELENFIHTPISNYSSGMKVRLGFSILIATNPDVILLDEVLAVGDRKFKAKCYKEIDKKTQTSGIILVSHNMALISRMCTRIMIFDKGETIFQSNNVLEGIDFYNTKFRIEETSITGMKEIELKDLKLFSTEHTENTKETFEVNRLDPLTIRMDLTIHPSIPNVAIRLGINNNNFMRIAEADSFLDGFDITNSTGELFLELNIKRINFAPGVYSITIEIFDTSKNLLKRCHAIKYFIVRGKSIAGSPSMLNSVWSQRIEIEKIEK